MDQRSVYECQNIANKIKKNKLIRYRSTNQSNSQPAIYHLNWIYLFISCVNICHKHLLSRAEHKQSQTFNRICFIHSTMQLIWTWNEHQRNELENISYSLSLKKNVSYNFWCITEFCPSSELTAPFGERMTKIMKRIEKKGNIITEYSGYRNKPNTCIKYKINIYTDIRLLLAFTFGMLWREYYNVYRVDRESETIVSESTTNQIENVMHT